MFLVHQYMVCCETINQIQKQIYSAQGCNAGNTISSPISPVLKMQVTSCYICMPSREQ
uniref:Uncharacterized protein n=1 Tax=Anguilla anguilla TaxID=7936 RepID=A0A0E9WEJ0_ANGAN